MVIFGNLHMVYTKPSILDTRNHSLQSLALNLKNAIFEIRIAWVGFGLDWMWFVSASTARLIACTWIMSQKWGDGAQGLQSCWGLNRSWLQYQCFSRPFLHHLCRRITHCLLVTCWLSSEILCFTCSNSSLLFPARQPARLSLLWSEFISLANISFSPLNFGRTGDPTALPHMHTTCLPVCHSCSEVLSVHCTLFLNASDATGSSAAPVFVLLFLFFFESHGSACP